MCVDCPDSKPLSPIDKLFFRPLDFHLVLEYISNYYGKRIEKTHEKN